MNFFHNKTAGSEQNLLKVCRFVWRCLIVEGSDPFFTKKHPRFYTWNFYPQNAKKARKYELFEVCIYFIAQVWCGKRDLNPYVKDTRPSNVPVCQFQHCRICYSFRWTLSFCLCSVSFSLIIIAFIFSIVKAFFKKNSTIYKYTYRILICICLNSAIDKSVRRYNSFVGLDILKQSIPHGTSTQPCKNSNHSAAQGGTVSLIMNFFNKKRRCKKTRNKKRLQPPLKG